MNERLIKYNHTLMSFETSSIFMSMGGGNLRVVCLLFTTLHRIIFSYPGLT